MASNIEIAVGVSRPPFLILAPACVFLGVSTAYFYGGEIEWVRVVLILIGALMAHISVNALNEYVDFKTGLDFLTKKTPFSGGTGTLPENPESAPVALSVGLISLLLAIFIGTYLALSAPGLWIIGALGVLIVITYTSWINKSPILCLVAPGIGFGLLMVIGTYYALVKQVGLEVVLVSLVPFFLVNNLLLLNQFPDTDADRQIGRHHISIAKGKVFASRVYVLGLLASLAVLVGAVFFSQVPAYVLLGVLVMALSLPLSVGVLRNAENTEKLIPFMGMNVIVTVGTPVLMAVGFLVS